MTNDLCIIAACMTHLHHDIPLWHYPIYDIRTRQSYASQVYAGQTELSVSGLRYSQ